MRKEHWWASFGFRKTDEPAPDTDYADMGTAFGLDASLSPADDEAPAPAAVPAGRVPDARR